MQQAEHEIKFSMMIVFKSCKYFVETYLLKLTPHVELRDAFLPYFATASLFGESLVCLPFSESKFPNIYLEHSLFFLETKAIQFN